MVVFDLKTIRHYIYSFKAVLYGILLLCPFLYSCEQVKPEEPQYKQQNKTVLIYMAANNNLTSNATTNFSDLLGGYIPENDNLVVYKHQPNEIPVLLRVGKKGDTPIVDTLYKFSINTVSASSKTVTSVLNITKTLCPANKYGVVFWSHATGWLPQGFYTNPTGYGETLRMAQMSLDPYAHLVKSYGSERDPVSGALAEVEVVDLVKAIPFELEFVIFDACLMGEIEVAYEFKDKAKYFIASPTEIMAAGFPYRNIAEHMFAEDVNAKEIAKAFYEYYNAKTGEDKSGVIGAFALDSLAKVAEVSKEIFEKYRTEIPTVNKAEIQKYYRNDKAWYYDFSDFMKQVCRTDAQEFEKFKKALDNATIYKNATEYFINITINRTCGISTYIPDGNSVLAGSYRKLAWNKDVQMIPYEQ